MRAAEIRELFLSFFEERGHLIEMSLDGRVRSGARKPSSEWPFHTTLYRARVIGLSQSAAQSVCDRLRSRGACMVLSPDAQG